MKDDPTYRPPIIWVLIILQFLLGLGAPMSGLILILAPQGQVMQMPLDMRKTTSFASFLLLGILLFIFVGMYPLAVAYSLFERPSWSWPDLVNPFKNRYWAWAASLTVGVIVIIWMCVQVITFGTIHFLHVLYLAWGVAIILLTLDPSVRRKYARTI